MFICSYFQLFSIAQIIRKYLMIKERNQSSEQQIKSEIESLSPNSVLFKIFGEEHFSFQSAEAPSLVDWSGFYTQLTPEHSMRYLTKKWDDGAVMACLVALRPLQTMTVLRVRNDSLFGSHSISGEQKALLIKQHLNSKSRVSVECNENHCQRYQFQDPHKELLVHRLGQENTLLQCVDSEDQEIVIAHELLNGKRFEFEEIVQFKKSTDGMLRTVAWKFPQSEDTWHSVKGESQFEPYLIVEEEEQIRERLLSLLKQA